MSIWITEVGSDDIIFQFFDRELPEDIEFGKSAALKKIRYPGGHQTNQPLGVFEDEKDWTGVFYGTYFINGQLVTASERVEQLQALIGRPLRVGFPGVGDGGPVPGRHENTAKKSSEYKGGHKGIYIIESVKPKKKNHLHIEYTIKLVPHQRQVKIIPTETTTIKIKTRVIDDSVGTLKSTNSSIGQAAAKRNNITSKAVTGEKPFMQDFR